jgi:hypothetical protein
MNKKNLEIEQKALLEIIMDMEEHLREERDRFHAAGNCRTIAAHTWREGTKVKLLKYKKQLVGVQRRLRELETPDEVIEQALLGTSLWYVLKLWWKL